MVTQEAAAKRRARCWKCAQAWWQANEKRMKAELSAAAKAAAGRAAELLDAVPVAADVPARWCDPGPPGLCQPLELAFTCEPWTPSAHPVSVVE